MKALNLFANPIWMGQYPGDLSAFQQRARDMFNGGKNLTAHIERGGGTSTSEDLDAPHMWPEAREFLMWAQAGSDAAWANWHYPNTQKFIGKSWVNHHPTGAWTTEHIHGNVDQVMVLYLEQPEQGGLLEIQDPMMYHWAAHIHNSDYQLWQPLAVEQGSVVIFPGWMLHRSQANSSDKNRYTASFNVIGT